MKTIGVLGGMGPQATMDFEQRVHRVAQRKIPPHVNSGYPPMVVLYHRRPPVLIEPDGTPGSRSRSIPRCWTPRGRSAQLLAEAAVARAIG